VSDIDDKTLTDAWQQLEQRLIEANKHYLMHADGGRAAVFRQIGAINEFISRSAPGHPLLHIPLLALYLSLHYLDHGIVEPMLAPNKSGRGRRPQQQVIRIRSAVAMSQLQGIGYERREAAKRVGRELDRLGFKATTRAVADWRDRRLRTKVQKFIDQCSILKVGLSTARKTQAIHKLSCAIVYWKR
jgi:hypothetical protein